VVVSHAFKEMYLDELNRRRAENSKKLESTLKELQKLDDIATSDNSLPEDFLSYREGLKATVATLERQLNSHARRVKVCAYGL